MNIVIVRSWFVVQCSVQLIRNLFNFIKFEQTFKVREMLVFSSASSYSTGLLTGVLCD